MNGSVKWQKIGLSVLCVVLALVLIVLTFATVYVNYLLSKVGRVNPEDEGTLSPEQLATATETMDPTYTGPYVDPTEITLDINTDDVEPVEGVINILLVGQDRREGEVRARSDVMILCTFNTVKNTINITSFMRDTWVFIPGKGYKKLNAAYLHGGFSLLDETLAVNFGIHVDANVMVDFYGFTDVIDLLGGVDIELTSKEAAYMNEHLGFEYNQGENWNLTAGVNHLTGAQALAYARIRKIDSDFGRTQRQRTVLLALIDAYKNQSLGNMLGLIDDVLPLVTTDMTNKEIVSYVVTLFPMLSSANISTLHIPAAGTYVDEYLLGTGSSLIPDLPANRAILEELFRTD